MLQSRQYWRGLPRRRPSPSSTPTIPKKDFSGLNRMRRQSRNSLPRQTDRPRPRLSCGPGRVVDLRGAGEAPRSTPQSLQVAFGDRYLCLVVCFVVCSCLKRTSRPLIGRMKNHGEVVPGVVSGGCSQWPRYARSTLISSEVQAKTSLCRMNWIDPLRAGLPKHRETNGPDGADRLAISLCAVVTASVRHRLSRHSAHRP